MQESRVTVDSVSERIGRDERGCMYASGMETFRDISLEDFDVCMLLDVWKHFATFLWKI